METTSYLPNAVVEWSEQDNQQYHSNKTILSNSSVGLYIRSPRLYGKWLAGQWERPASDALRFGSAVDGLLFGTFDGELVIRPKMDRRTKAGKAAYAEFVATLNGRTEITQDEYETAKQVAEEIQAHPIASGILSVVEKPQLTLWGATDNVDVQWRCKLDGWSPGVVVELKTHRSYGTGEEFERNWAKNAHAFGYHRQAWLYRHMVALMENKPIEKIRHFTIAAENEEPFSVRVLQYEDVFMEKGREELDFYSRHLVYQRHMDSFDAPDTTIHQIGAPSWLIHRRT